MDVGIEGVLLLWFLIFWPLISVIIFYYIKSSTITNKKLFIYLSIVSNYAIGFILNFIFPSSIMTVASIISSLFGINEHSNFRSNLDMIIILGIHILIPCIIYYWFKTKSNKTIKT